MTELNYDQIRAKAHELHEAKAKWHFHILTPGCALNEQDKYLFIVEQTDQPQSWVYYSDKIEKELDQELLPLLHGDDVLKHETTDQSYQPSETVQQMVELAGRLNAEGKEWHHHMLFPDCQFNSHKRQFALILEDPETKVALENVTDEEPLNDLKQIEPLFVGKVAK